MKIRMICFGAVLALSMCKSEYAAHAQSELGLITGVAFIDANGNGARDAGEPIASARVKITDGGSWYVCGAASSEGGYGAPVKPGKYFVLPVAGAGEYTTAPVIAVNVARPGDAVRVDLPLGRSEKAQAEQCGEYAPKRTARVPFGIPEAVSAAGAPVLANALQLGGLFDALSGKGPFTVFAPNDAAFGKLTDVQLGFILGDKSLLKSTLNYHVVAGKWKAEDLATVSALKTLNGAELVVEQRDGAIYVGGAKVVASDITAANGVVHIVDAVLVP